MGSRSGVFLPPVSLSSPEMSTDEAAPAISTQPRQDTVDVEDDKITPVLRTLEEALGTHLSNQTMHGTGYGAFEALPPEMQFLSDFAKSIVVQNLTLPGRRQNLISWGQLIVNASSLWTHKINAVLTLNNTFPAGIDIGYANATIFVDKTESMPLGTVEWRFDPPWHVPGHSSTSSPKIVATLILQECLDEPWNCLFVLERILGENLARVELHELHALAAGKFALDVSATEWGVPLSMHPFPNSAAGAVGRHEKDINDAPSAVSLCISWLKIGS